MIFADTSFWIAFRNRADNLHADAVAAMKARAGEAIVTTNHVRGETWTFLRRRAGFRSAADFLDSIHHSPRIRVVFVDEKSEAKALQWLKRHGERPYSFVDATSFVVMKSHKIHEALAFDEDFEVAGFRQLLD